MAAGILLIMTFHFDANAKRGLTELISCDAIYFQHGATSRAIDQVADKERLYQPLVVTALLTVTAGMLSRSNEAPCPFDSDGHSYDGQSRIRRSNLSPASLQQRFRHDSPPPAVDEQ